MYMLLCTFTWYIYVSYVHIHTHIFIYTHIYIHIYRSRVLLLSTNPNNNNNNTNNNIYKCNNNNNIYIQFINTQIFVLNYIQNSILLIILVHKYIHIFNINVDAEYVYICSNNNSDILINFPNILQYVSIHIYTYIYIM